MKVDPHILTIVFGLLGALLVLLIVRTLLRWNAAPTQADSFDFHDLVMENGKASRGGTVLMGAFVVSSWAIFYYSLSHSLTDGMFWGYLAAWVTPVVARIIAYSPGAQPPSGSATATASAPGSTATVTVPAAAPAPIAPAI